MDSYYRSIVTLVQARCHMVCRDEEERVYDSYCHRRTTQGSVAKLMSRPSYPLHAARGGIVQISVALPVYSPLYLGKHGCPHAPQRSVPAYSLSHVCMCDRNMAAPMLKQQAVPYIHGQEFVRLPGMRQNFLFQARVPGRL